MTELAYDLHIHSCLSPCGDNDMTPHNIAAMAHIKGLKILALTDHNTCRNAPALIEVAKEFDLIVLPGMELTTQEEVHVLCLFAEEEAAADFDAYVYERLQKVPNRTEFFGEQILMNAQDERVGEEEYLLSNATAISFDSVKETVESFEGIMIPAHLEKESTSLISNLGFIPPDARFTCAEINHPEKLPALKEAHPYLEQCRIVTNSDAHTLGAISEPLHTLSFGTDMPSRKEILDLLAKERTGTDP